MLVAALRVKNEAWILRFTLTCLTEFCDAIVIVDDGSSDGTLSVVDDFSKVAHVHQNRPTSEADMDEPRDWNRLTQMAQEVGASWILYLDADEMISKRFVPEFENAFNQTDYDVVRFPKITPWFDFYKYRSDLARFNHPADKVLNPILVRAKNSLHWDNNRGGKLKMLAKRILRGEKKLPNYGRVYPLGVKKNAWTATDYPSMHYNFMNYNKILRKQIFYAIRERELRPDKSRLDIIAFAATPLIKGKENFQNINKADLWEEFLPLVIMEAVEQ